MRTRFDPQGALGPSARIEALAEQFHTPLKTYFERRARTPEDAEDLTQEVFVRLLHRSGADEIDNVASFIFVTAANLLKDYYRSHARRGQMQSTEGLDFVSLAPNPAQQAEGKAEIGVLLKAIQALPPKCRAVFVMHRFDELRHTEIARRLGISVSMVEKHIAAAIRQLRETLDGGHA
ncbi:RNA polymerase sigma factor [Rhizorhabdus dicambivorans]|uniref:RNA polymerase sigma factor n=1 Tax=Rhizorhabdus dicambivorans TaxID=1850238 RepID=UPI000A69B4A7|nr:sigma-70 family RNA polymerase sigma factor [Rhizorhabdus dicambivorans]